MTIYEVQLGRCFTGHGDGDDNDASNDDATAAARVLFNFAKDHKKLELKAGVVEGIVYDKAGVEKLATIPSREVLIAKLLGSFKAPLSNLAYLLNAIKEKKESESAE